MHKLAIVFAGFTVAVVPSIAFGDPAASINSQGPARRAKRTRTAGDQRHAAQTLDIKTRQADGSTKDWRIKERQ